MQNYLLRQFAIQQLSAPANASSGVLHGTAILIFQLPADDVPASTGVGIMLNAACESAGPVAMRTVGLGSGSIAAVRDFIDRNFAQRITLKRLAALSGLSVFRFATVFSREIGIPPHRYLCQVRVRAAQKLLRSGVRPAIAAIEVGFFDQSHLCRHFRAVCGTTPGRYLATIAQLEALA